MKTNFTVGSLYAGVGGICLGFIQSGFKLLWAMGLTRTLVLPTGKTLNINFMKVMS